MIVQVTRQVNEIRRVTDETRIVRPVEKVIHKREVVNQTISYLGGNYEETLSGTIDGVNRVFTTTYNFITGTTRVYKNGLKQQITAHYTESGTNEITFDEAPDNTGFEDILTINYLKDS